MPNGGAPDARSLAIAPATPADRPAIVAILEDARRRLAAKRIVQWTEPFAADWIEEKIGAGEFHVARLDVARRDGTPVAVVRLLWADPLFWGAHERGDAAYVHTLAVGRDHAGLGIGTQVLSWAAAQARAHGRTYLRLDCMPDNPALRAYDERAGFTPLGPSRLGLTTVLLFEKTLGH